ncbi:MAG: glutathione S-transferase C-terminal domain-containing protein [Proteobacteria bacterium]|nr:glutathione S-transferase C-terminal domain-containing protein [Pseudomonadota bacterium]
MGAWREVETIRGLSGQHMVPIVLDGDQVIHDSWNIAIHLEQRFPEPSLFGGDAGRGLARVVNQWSDHVLGPAIRRLISADFILCLAPEDRDYFRSSREAAFGCSLEAYCADRPRWLAEFTAVISPLERTLREQRFLAGAAPSYADYLVFSVFQYARLGCPDDFVADGTALRAWRDGLAAAFDGLGHRYPKHPALAG